MPIQSYLIDEFRGIDQNITENRLLPGFTPDCANFDTTDGNLTVGRGFVKFIEDEVPGTGEIWRMYLWHTMNAVLFVVCAGDAIYAYQNVSWVKIFDYASVLDVGEHITSKKWDFLECRLGDTDHLIIANGQTQMVKWSGTGSAEAFGSGEYLLATTIASVTFNATKAESVAYAEVSGKGTFTLTMPTGWTHSDGAKVAWTCPSDPGLLTSVDLVIGANTYAMEYVPILASGQICVVILTDTTHATAGDEPKEMDYGIEKLTLTDAMTEDVANRCKAVGIYIPDKGTLEVSDVDVTGTILTLTEITQQKIEAGEQAKVRGGLSDIPVNYVDIYMSRMVAAGDPDHPSRLYWSQPPGDTRTIEDWSMDDASDQTGGGYVEVGTVSADPIVGLCSISNQLIIFKKNSIYRMLGDRPTNFRVVQTNRDTDKTVNSAIISNGDVPYWITNAGMYYYDGQVAHISPNARQIHRILESVSLENTKSCENRDRLYYTCRAASSGPDDTIIVYDLRERTYLLRNGFTVIDVCAYDGMLYSINGNRIVYAWPDSARDYDGEPIEAYWNTPFTDLSVKSVVKAPFYIYARGEGGVIKVDVATGDKTQHKTYQVPVTKGEVLKIPLFRDECRTFGMKIYNEAGGWFRLLGGLELRYDTREDRNA